MLERTAASLESCNLQRIWPRPARSTNKKHRRLNTGFWQHGASALETSHICLPLPRLHDKREADLAASSQSTSLSASMFLLDFLYPMAARPLLRRLHPRLSIAKAGGSLADNQAQRRAFGKSGTRREAAEARLANVSLETNPEFNADQNEEFRIEKQDSSKGLTGIPSKSGSSQFSQAIRQPPNLDDKLADLKFPKTSLYTSQSVEVDSLLFERATQEADAEASQVQYETSAMHRKILQELLDQSDKDQSRDIWETYCKVEISERHNLRPKVLIYLSRSRNVVEIGRALSLLRQISASEMTNEVQAAAVLALMISGNTSKAVELLKQGLQSKALFGGLEYLLAEGIYKGRWSFIIEVWEAFWEASSSPTNKNIRARLSLDQLRQIPDLGRLYIAFEQHLAKSSTALELRLKSRTALGRALKALRRRFAILALEQPCSPKQASVILEHFKDHHLYHDYMLQMLERWSTGLESRASLTQLTDLYRDYRSFESAKPSTDLLQQTFDFFYPREVAGMKEIHIDWHRPGVEFTQRGYEQLLKLYARLGEVAVVRELWQRYISSFPDVVHMPMAFRSTLNVYAQVGDVIRAEREFANIRSKYGVDPDIDNWNTLLKCYVRVDDYHKVMNTLWQIERNSVPNASTYAHAMSLTARRGDLTKTLELWDKCQNSGIRVSKAMVLPLVNAYCLDGKPDEAEKSLTELANLGVTNLAAWNVLLRTYAAKAMPDKCLQTLQRMKQWDLEWDHSTYEQLLMAMVNARQLSAAFRLLRQAIQNKLFRVDPDHFAIVIGGAVKFGDYGVVKASTILMEKFNLPMNFNIHVSLLEAAHKTRPEAAHTKTLAKGLIQYITDHMAKRDTTKKGHWGLQASPADLVGLRKDTETLGKAVYLLVQIRELPMAEQIVNMYLDLFPRYRDGEPMPGHIASAVMTAYLSHRNWEKLNALWEQTWQHTYGCSRSEDGVSIYPAFEYSLCRPIEVVAQARWQQNDGKGLQQLVKQAIDAGFKLTQVNWTTIICNLASTGETEAAMKWCEQLLMSRWTGWAPRHVKSAEKRENRSTRNLRATPQIVLTLQREWHKMKALAPWSADLSSRFEQIEKACPRLVNAFRSSNYDILGKRGKWIIDGRMELYEAIDSALKPRSTRDLLDLRTELKRHLTRTNKQQASSLEFRHRVRDEKGQPTMEPMPAPKLKVLETALEKILARKREQRKPDKALSMTQSTLAKPMGLLGQETHNSSTTISETKTQTLVAEADGETEETRSEWEIVSDDQERDEERPQPRDAAGEH